MSLLIKSSIPIFRELISSSLSAKPKLMGKKTKLKPQRNHNSIQNDSASNMLTEQ